MFKVGREYRFEMIEDSTEGRGVTKSVWQVAAVEGHLLTLTNKFHKGEVEVNTGSLYFLKAELIEK